jgi:hypothetical protein
MRLGQIGDAVSILMTVAACGCSCGCSSVDGGAVELSWKLTPASGNSDVFVNCDSGVVDTGPVTRMRLDWQVGDVDGIETWNCSDYHGVTGFDLPPGTALLSVSPECNSGAAAVDTYTSPAPVQRTVVIGDTISLGAVEVVVQIDRCSVQPCICQ